MLHNYIHLLQQAEELADIDNAKKSAFPYKRWGNVWIRADKSLKEIYAQTLQYSEERFYPSSDYKEWGVWFLRLFQTNKNRRSFTKLMGIRWNWVFLKTESLPLQADIIYCRKHTIVMVYTSLKVRRVLKMAVTDRGKSLLKSEIDNQKLASSIESKEVFVPSVIKEFPFEGCDVKVEEYFQGKKQSFRNKKILEANYYKVFQFLIKFYLKNQIQLQSLSDNGSLNHKKVEEFIENQSQGSQVLSVCRNLFAKKKKMIKCMVHGDLSHHNILSNNDTVCIIDWGRSKFDYISRDLDNSSFNTQHVFDEFVVQAQINPSEIYSYWEQLFLGRFIDLSQEVYEGLSKNTSKERMRVRAQNQIKRLARLSVHIHPLV